MKRGSLSDAWEGLKISEQTSPLLPSAYRALLDRAVLTLINMTDGEGEIVPITSSSSSSFSSPSSSSAPSSSSYTIRKRMSKSQTVEAIAFCLYGLMAKNQSALRSVLSTITEFEWNWSERKYGPLLEYAIVFM